MTPLQPTSIVYQMTQRCPYRCGICNRRFVARETRLTGDERLRMLDRLAALGVRRITVTGGEPLVLGEEVYAFLAAAHDRGFHTALSTTGHGLTQEDISRLDAVLDHLLVSIRSLRRPQWLEDFGHAPLAASLYETVLTVLEAIRKTGIILEVSTVLHRGNLGEVEGLGRRLAELNRRLIWRLEDYYAMGIHAGSRELYQLGDDGSDDVRQRVREQFAGTFDHIYLASRNRSAAPDYMITPDGSLVGTAGHQYGEPVGSLLDPSFEPALHNRRPWSDYARYCRTWDREQRT